MRIDEQSGIIMGGGIEANGFAPDLVLSDEQTGASLFIFLFKFGRFIGILRLS